MHGLYRQDKKVPFIPEGAKSCLKIPVFKNVKNEIK